MASTYTLISSQVLASSAGTVDFVSIPQTYTDLVLRFSTRSSNSYILPSFTTNSTGGQYYSYTALLGDGSSATSTRANLAYSGVINGGTNASTSTANTFANGELYIPNYTVVGQKSISTFSVAENNSSTAQYIEVQANLINASAAVTSLSISPGSQYFVQYSSFYLYGISSS